MNFWGKHCNSRFNSTSIICCHLLPFIVPLVGIHCTTLCHSDIRCQTLYRYSLSFVVPLVATHCHSLLLVVSLIVTRFIICLSFYKRSQKNVFLSLFQLTLEQVNKWTHKLQDTWTKKNWSNKNTGWKQNMFSTSFFTTLNPDVATVWQFQRAFKKVSIADNFFVSFTDTVIHLPQQIWNFYWETELFP